MNIPSAPLGVRLLHVALAPLAALLVACGGGGSSGPSLDSPPTTGATLTASADTAAGAAKSAVAAADAAVDSSNSLSGLFPFLAGAVASGKATPQSVRKRPLATENLACYDIFDQPCSGTVLGNTNLTGNETTIPAGGYIDLTFNQLSGISDGDSVALDGRMRMTFSTGFNPDDPNASLDMTLKFTGLSGSVNGRDFGPVTAVARFQIAAQGDVIVTIDGRRFSGLSGLSQEGEGNYSIGSGRVRSAYWGDASRYVDADFADWSVSGGRPTVGSEATITGAGGSILVVVNEVTSNTVVYGVSITVGDTVTVYVVTATYPAGGGVPTYSASQPS